MYTIKKTNLLIPLLLLSFQAHNTKTFGFRNSFREMFEEMDQAFQNMRHEFKTRFHTQEQLKPEDQEIINKQLEIASNMKPEITKDENGLVSIVLPIDNIEKEKIELSLEHGLLHGFLPLKNGWFRFVIYPNFIKCAYELELVRESKQETPAAEADKTEIQHQENANYSHTVVWHSSNSFMESLPLEVDLAKAQSETKNNKLFIKLEPKSYTRLKIRHS